MLGTTSKVILEDTRTTSSMMWTPFPGSPKLKNKFDDVLKSDSMDYAGLMFGDELLAKKMLGAFKHAADLCRGKEAF